MGKATRWLIKHLFIGCWFPVFIYGAMIFIFSSIPRPPSPPGAEVVPFYSNLAHMLVFAGFSAVLFFALDSTIHGQQRKFVPIFAILITFAYGLTDEVHQFYVPGRTMDVIDVLTDLTGAFLTQAAIYVGKRLSSLR